MTARQTKIKAPAHLSKGAGALYVQIHAQYVLEAHHDAILIKSLEAFDRAEAARLIVERDGVLVTSRLGEIKASPSRPDRARCPSRLPGRDQGSQPRPRARSATPVSAP